MFKVGDKVRIKSGTHLKECKHLYEGKIGTLKDYWPHNIYGEYHVVMEGGFNNCFFFDELEDPNIENNMEKIDKAIEILQAFKEGKTIEWHSNELSKWVPFNGNLGGLLMKLLDYDTRIAKEPTYRHYANAEEFLKASKEHGPYIKQDDGIYFMPNQVLDNEIGTYEGTEGEIYITYKALCEQGYLFQDSTPCGILEQ